MGEDRALDEAGLIIPSTRDVLLQEWDSDPNAVLQKAKECELPLDSYLNARAGPSAESPGSTCEWLLYNQGVRMNDTFDIPSTQMKYLPKFGETGTRARLMMAYWDERYNDSLLCGTRAVNTLGLIERNTVWREIYEEMPFRMPQIAPAFDFRMILGFARRIRETDYRLNKLTNAKGEQVMQVLAEGTEPRLFEMARTKQLFEMTEYRAGIEATDSFLNDPGVRASDITNAVEEIGIGHRIVLLRTACKLITDKTPSANVTTRASQGAIAGVTAAAGEIKYPQWVEFMTKFGTAYRGDCVIGNPQAITNFKLMSMTDGDNLTLSSWASIPGTNTVDFNGDMMDIGYGWVDADSATGFSNNNLWVFQRATTIGYVQRMGMDQDELERDAGPRITRRWLGTESLFCEIDTNGMRRYDFT